MLPNPQGTPRPPRDFTWRSLGCPREAPVGLYAPDRARVGQPRGGTLQESSRAPG